MSCVSSVSRCPFSNFILSHIFLLESHCGLSLFDFLAVQLRNFTSSANRLGRLFVLASLKNVFTESISVKFMLSWLWLLFYLLNFSSIIKQFRGLPSDALLNFLFRFQEWLVTQLKVGWVSFVKGNNCLTMRLSDIIVLINFFKLRTWSKESIYLQKIFVFILIQ